MAKKSRQGGGAKDIVARIKSLEGKMSDEEKATAEKLLKEHAGKSGWKSIMWVYLNHSDRGPILSTGGFTKREEAEIARAEELFGSKGAEKLREKIREGKAAKK